MRRYRNIAVVAGDCLQCWVKGQVISQVEAALNRKVVIEEMDVNLYGTAVKLSGLRVHAADGFEQDTVKVGELSVKLAGMALLSGKVHVLGFSLNDVDIVVERNAEGAFSFDDLTQGGAQAPAPEGGAQAKPLDSIQIDDLAVKNVNLIFIDRLGGTESTSSIRNLDVALSKVAVGENVKFAISANVLSESKNLEIDGSAGPLDAALALPEAQVDFNLKITDLELGPVAAIAGLPADLIKAKLNTNMSAKGSAKQAAATGNVTLQLGAAPALGINQALTVSISQKSELDLQAFNLNIQQAEVSVEDLVIGLVGQIKNLTSTPELDVKVTSGELDMQSKIAQLALPFVQAALGQPVALQGKVGFSATAKGTPANMYAKADIKLAELSMKTGSFLNVEDKTGGLHFTTDSTQLQAGATIQNGKRPAIDLRRWATINVPTLGNAIILIV